MVKIANLYEAGKIQYFEWGHMLWLIEPHNIESERLSVGMVTFKPYVTRGEHLHTGEEQVFYVLAGHGIHTIDDVKDTLNPGEIKCIPSYVRHNVINDSAEELIIIVVSTPAKLRYLLGRPDIPHFLKKSNALTLLDIGELKGELQELVNKLEEAITMSIGIIDINGNFMIKSSKFPKFCMTMCRATNEVHCQISIREACRNAAMSKMPYLLSCCFHINSVIMPIYLGDNIIGYICSGHVFLNIPDEESISESFSILCDKYRISKNRLLEEYHQIKLEPKSRLYAAAEATLVIANYITGMASIALRQKELNNNKIALIKEQITKNQLEQSLREADLKLLQSRINPHFLFNTLNTIAQMAYLDGSYRVANLVWDLSGILHCTLRKTDQMISLREEIMLLKKYIDIQLSRYGDRLIINLDIDYQLNNAIIPCMLLMPLVENAIIHGFERSGRTGIISISVQQSGGNLVIIVEDNGPGFESVASSEGMGIGIQSTKSRLKYYYGDSYVFNIDSIPGKGAKVVISFPKMEGSNYEWQ